MEFMNNLERAHQHAVLSEHLLIKLPLTTHATSFAKSILINIFMLEFD